MFFSIKEKLNKYYQKHKERLRKEPRERYQNLSVKEKDKRQKMARERYQNFTEEEEEKRRQYSQQRKKKLPDYRKNYYLKQKNQLFGLF